uniref:Uncharacterized protein n=1 Tax=Magallana gigas TaxID=29159 RepID=K1QUT6_MAGGI
MTNVFNAESGDSSCPVVCQVSTDAERFKQRERGCPGSSVGAFDVVAAVLDRDPIVVVNLPLA